MSKIRKSPDKEMETLLAAWSQGDAGALEILIPLIVPKLRSQARVLLRRESDSYAPEELVNDLYLRLRALRSPRFWSISSFYAYSVRVMQHLLVDRARARRAVKRGGWAEQVELSEIDEEDTPSEELEADTRLTLESLLEGLNTKSPTIRKIATLHLELGYTTKEIADELKLNRRAVTRQWEIAKNYITGNINASAPPFLENVANQGSSSRIIKPIVNMDLVSPELIRALTLHPELMKTLDWRAFEYLLSTILEKLEYEVELQRGTKDGGIDIFAIKRGGPLGPHRYLLQAKRWSAAVDVQPVRELLFLRDQHRVTKACLATTSRFTRGAWKLGDEYQWVLELRDYFGLQEWVRLCNAG
jgi:RNA polymerase sigma factor (TIGR02999 family)